MCLCNNQQQSERHTWELSDWAEPLRRFAQWGILGDPLSELCSFPEPCPHPHLWFLS